MKKEDLNLISLIVFFQSTVHQLTTLKGTVHGNMGGSLDKWFKEGRSLIKMMGRKFDEDTKEDIEQLQIITIDIMENLLKLEDKEHFIKYLNQYEQPSKNS